ncbi:MAG: PTS transporter subunit EIIC [Oscillospiraceae bacterium]|nr:PTS transporter subunit EIIC [Oscillospiraceae bacterium]
MAKKDTNIPMMAQQIVREIGGRGNVAQLNHCATRLRINVADPGKVNVEALKKIDGVFGVELAGDYLQVIVGAIIEDLFLATESLTGVTGGGNIEKPDGPKQKKTIAQTFSSFLLMMAGILSPVVPALIASGLLSTVLTIMTVFLHVDASNPTYQILNNLSQTVFYFLPVLVAYTSAKKFGTEPVLAMVLACFLLYPDWVSAAAEGGFTSYFGLPVLRTTYNGAVIQIILSVFIMAQLDKVLKKVIPEAARHFLKPFLLLLLTSVVTLTVTGPLGGLFTDYIAMGVEAIRNVAPWAVVPAIILFASTVGLIMPGFHLALIPIAMASLSSVGYDDFINIWFFCCTITPGFIALAVGLKTKKSSLRQIAFPACLSALLGGISEPTTYGICYKMVKPFYAYFITAFTTGILTGILHLKCYAFGGYSLTNILLYLGPNSDVTNFRNAIILVVYMAVMSFITVNLIGFDDSVYDDEEDAA